MDFMHRLYHSLLQEQIDYEKQQPTPQP